MSRPLELPAWFLALALLTAGAVGGGACAGAYCLADWARGRRT